MGERNYNKNITMAQPPSGKMINGQGLGDVSRLKYGSFNMSFNGCEVISVYNALVYLGKETAICDIARYMEKFRVLLGLFGCNVYRIGKALEHFGVNYERIKTAAEADKADAFIISSWTGTRLMSSVHTVFCVRTDGKIHVFNRYNNCGNVRVYDSAAKIFEGKKTLVIYKIKK